jgi:hypothetical protein
MVIVIGDAMRRFQATTLLSTFLLATSTFAKPARDIFERASTCGNAQDTQCSQAGLPSNFCCGPTSSCIVLAGNTTVLCCPSGSSCSTIKAVGCDISLQNVTANPGISLMTTALTATLPKCGDSCCPFGYTCNSAEDCVLDANQDITPTISSTSSTASGSATGASSSVTPVANESQDAASCSKFPITAILVGAFPGLVLGALLATASICCLGARGKRKSARRQSGSSFGNISDPQPQSDMRTDFLRKQPGTPSTMSMPTRQPTVQRVRSLFRKSSTSTASLRYNPKSAPPVPELPGHNGRPVTPVLQREPSYENINIFADGDTASALRESEKNDSARMTTFSDMMVKSGLAGLEKGQREFALQY